MVTLAVATDNVQETLKNLKTSGVKLIYSEQPFSSLGDWFALEDPFGNIHEMVQFNHQIIFSMVLPSQKPTRTKFHSHGRFLVGILHDANSRVTGARVQISMGSADY